MPCAVCGFAREHSSFTVRSNARVAFTNLASGGYSVRIADEHGRTIGDPVELVLAAGAATSIAFDATRSRRVEIDFTDVDGTSLTEEWSRRVRVALSRPVSMEQTVVDDSEDALLVVVAEGRREVAHTTFVPPTRDGTARVIGGILTGRRIRSRHLTATSPLADRARRANDPWRPDTRAPPFPNAEIECEILASGLVRIEPLPTSRLDLRVSTVRSSAVAEIPASLATTRVSVRLHAP
jgi:mRNA-degrading endonuclease toxin of MazEF toxin-antitoxin module